MNALFRGGRFAKIGRICLLGTTVFLSMGCGSKPDTRPSVDPSAVQTVTPGQGNSLPPGTKAVKAPLPPGATGSVSDTFVKPGG